MCRTMESLQTWILLFEQSCYAAAATNHCDITIMYKSQQTASLVHSCRPPTTSLSRLASLALTPSVIRAGKMEGRLISLRCIYDIISLERVQRISPASRCEVTAVSDLDLYIRRLANEMLVI